MPLGIDAVAAIAASVAGMTVTADAVRTGAGRAAWRQRDPHTAWLSDRLIRAGLPLVVLLAVTAIVGELVRLRSGVGSDGS